MMKGKLKYLISGLMLLEVSVFFIPVINIENVKITLVDILKIGFGNSSQTGFLNEIENSVRGFMKPYIYIAMLLCVLIFIGALLTCIQRGRNAYVFAFISQILISGLGYVVYNKITEKTQSLKELAQIIGITGGIEFNIFPMVVWVILQILIAGMAVCGFIFGRKPSRSTISNGYIEEVLPNSRDINIPSVPVHVTSRSIENEKFDEEDVNFTGVLIGNTVIYKGKGYPLEELKRVYFVKEDEQVILKKEAVRDLLVSIYYIPQYKEYCIRPSERKIVYLASGQPLGGNREYYLPRGTEIYIQQKENSFILA